MMSETYFVLEVRSAHEKMCIRDRLKVAAAGYEICFHIHDELIVEVPKQDADQHLAVIRKLMGSKLTWAPELYLTAAGYTSDYYLKD